jgi:perosamine synthetase
MPVQHTIPISEPVIGERELAYVTDAVQSGWISSLGPYVEKFERALADFCNTEHAVAVSNGTAALELSLMSLGVGSGDEVIVPDFTFVATANAVRHVGATPVLADSDPEHWCLDPHDVARKITPRTRAVLPVHLFGQPADLGRLLELARLHNLFVVEDAAQALGATFRGAPVGGVGHAGTFSFYGNKVITTGEGGMVVTNDASLAARMRLLRNHGQASGRPYWHETVGYNFRLTNLQAAVGVAQMEQLPALLERKRTIMQRYHEGLADVPGLILQRPAPWGESSLWLFTLLVGEEAPLSRDELVASLVRDGIDARPSYHAIHTLPPYAGDGGCFPVADRLSLRGLSLPSSAALRAEDQDYIIRRLCEYTDHRSPRVASIASQ